VTPHRGVEFHKATRPGAVPGIEDHGVYKDATDYNIFSGGWLIGRLYERHGFPADVRFFWSLHGVVLTRAPGIHTFSNEPSLEMAKARLKRSWDRWLEWSKRVEVE
jgi:hypothetical protein